MSVNKVILVGNLGADPEVRSTNSGSQVANLRIATTSRTKDRDGNWSDETEWHRVTCFGRTAENVQRFLRKGRQVYVEGRLRTRKWQDQNGNDRWSTEVIANNVVFLGGRDGGGGGGGGGYSGGGGGGGDFSGGGGGGGGGGGFSGDSGGFSGGDSGDEDIPF